MQRIKIDYGIDLGTTNSAICRMEKGEPVVIKSDTQKDTIPSCIGINRKQSIRVGDTAFNQLKSDKRVASKNWQGDSNTFVEFKRTMGTDKEYFSSNAGRAFTSEELSAEVLKKLLSFVLDENITSAIVTVPAKFTVNQTTATMEAAKMAGIEHCELLQEPIAAAMAYGLKAEQKDAIWMVFDFGGGTFDSALIKVEDGIIQVFDTEGDNYLGGKNLDEAIVDKIIIPHLKEEYELTGILADKTKKQILYEALKTYAEDAKNQLSFVDEYDILSNLGELGEDDNGDELEIDLTISRRELNDTILPYFQKAVTTSIDLLKRNQMTGASLDSLILVGGPTHSPLLREMLTEQITTKVDTSIDPMTAVATGAALYASTIDNLIDESEITSETIKLDISYEATSVALQEWLSVKLSESSSDSLRVEITRADAGWSSGLVELNDKGDVIELQLIEGRANSFQVSVFDQQGNRRECFPSEFTIIQGSKVGAAPLPYNIGIAINDYKKEKVLYTGIEGLERNKPLPAVGANNGRKTNADLRPGISTDVIRIPIYQGDEGAEGKTASLFEWVTDVVITGDEVNQLIPSGSTVDLTIKVDGSQMMSLEAYFPQQDITIAKEIYTSKKQSLDDAEHQVQEGLNDAYRSIQKLKGAGLDVGQLESEMMLVKEERDRGNDPKATLQHMKEAMRKIEEMDYSTEWNRLEKELREEFTKLEQEQQKQNKPEVNSLVDELRKNVDEAIRQKEVKLGESVLEEVRAAYIKLTLAERLAEIILIAYHNFDNHEWKNPVQARQLVNQGMQLLSSNPSIQALQSAAQSIITALADGGRSLGGDLLS